MHHLAAGMDAGVGASGGLDANGMVGDRAEGCFQLALDAGAVQLRLPAAVTAAEIFNPGSPAPGYGFILP